MTDLLPDTTTCTATKHGNSQHAWRRFGCRCPGALAAHERELQSKRKRRQQASDRIAVEGACGADEHVASNYAWQLGCRCPGAVVKHEQRIASQRRVGRYQKRDPRVRWRGPDKRVNWMNLYMLLRGYPDSPTYGEKMAAVHILTRTGNRWGTGLNSTNEIAERIGVTPDRVRSIKDSIKDRRRGRAIRRLADAQWREMQRERAIERGRGHDRSGHPIHPLWMAAAYRALTEGVA